MYILVTRTTPTYEISDMFTQGTCSTGSQEFPEDHEKEKSTSSHTPPPSFIYNDIVILTDEFSLRVQPCCHKHIMKIMYQGKNIHLSRSLERP